MIDPTLQWLYSAERDGGGISAWRTEDGRWSSPYPEVTGYLLPTLLKWGAFDLAGRCAEWLMDKQNKDGSWSGMDGVHRPFDTAAIVEGLRRIPAGQRAADRGEKWLKSQITEEGFLVNSPQLKQAEAYNQRASAIIGNKRELDYRKSVGFAPRERAHYMAYALEGALNLGDVEWAKPILEKAHAKHKGLVPFYVDREWNGDGGDMDVCATAQLGILFLRVGLSAEGQYRAVQHEIQPNGGVPQGLADRRQISWAAKFWLDFQEAYCG